MRVEVVPSRSEWAIQYTAEEDSLRQALGAQAVMIAHIGSTSIPGLAAKPVIDIAVGISSLVEFDSSPIPETLVGCGYVHRIDLQPLVPFRRFFTRVPSESFPAVNLHIAENRHPWNDRHLLFRDYLRRSESARSRYQELKLNLATQDWNDLLQYNAAKEELILTLEDEAMDLFEMSDQEKVRIRSSHIS